MDTFIDFSSGSMNKYKEELCGDKVKMKINLLQCYQMDFKVVLKLIF